MLKCQNMIAYFSMEIGFRNEIPTYSGGLGVLAGDTLKSFSDLGMDVVGVTLLSEKGYFYQELDKSGYQHEQDYNWSVDHLLNKLDVEVSVQVEGREVFVNAWEYVLTGETGKKLRILFLDTNNEKNSDHDRVLTSHLYGGDNQYRLQQEIILGIAGVKILRQLDYCPRKYHMNEGHAAFLICELYNELNGTEEEKHQFIRHLCSFTTHTPVAAGHDGFDVHMLQRQLGNQLPHEILDRVRIDNFFSMSRLALHFSEYVNSVARKHQEVSKKMFPEFDIDYITNGIHATTWVGKHIAALFDTHVLDWRTNPMNLRNAHKIPLDELTSAHNKAKQDLIDYANTTMNSGLEYDVFTIGFARRATGYKRADLLFRDIERLKHISRDVGKIQLIFAGKAHPHDEQGKQIIKHIHDIARLIDPAIKLVFIENYNMHVASLMVQGVDVWLNTPKRPLEASGTSGMKATINGVPSLSIPDGWWVEGLIEDVTGWGIGPEYVHGDEYRIDEQDANDLYHKLEEVIVPMYYNDRKQFSLIRRNAIAINGSYFNTHRMAKQYLVRAYAKTSEYQKSDE